MLHRLSANHESFHTITFVRGLNVIVAERSTASSEKDTCNGVGKSTLIEIINFCMGSRTKAGEGLLIPALADWTFTLELSLGGNRLEVTRAVADPNRIVVNGFSSDWNEQPRTDDATGDKYFSAERWRALLGALLFRIPEPVADLKYRPHFRSLFSYLVRHGSDAYGSPFRHYRQQKTWDMQLHVAYLLGMNWEYASRWQDLKDQDEGLAAIETAISTGAMEGVAGSVGELETRLIQLEDEGRRTRDALNSFKVHPQYESLQSEADRITRRLHELADQGVVFRQRLARYSDSMKGEHPPAAVSLERLYEEAGVVLSGQARRSLEEARVFHEAIVSNRREFLRAEVERLEGSLESCNADIKALTDERASLLEVLRSHGALQEMSVLQERHTALQVTLEQVQARLTERKNLKAKKRGLRKAKTDLIATAERDHEERRPVWSAAVRLFNEHSQALYRSPGRLVIDVSDTGYQYHVEIERDGSEGIEKMKIFCFDLAVLELQVRAGRGIDFLIHDTLMYDSVDARQRALAFQRAHEVTEALGAQYICTINSDMVPSGDFTEGFDLGRFVRLTLSDASPSGRLLGLQFERPRRGKRTEDV